MIRLLQFILAISLLVLLHEGGHFFFSKLFGVRVEKFFIFFDLGIGKWSGKLLKFKPKNSDTEYGMGWLPLGGYCKIAGMIDESFDTEQMKQPVQSWEFRSKPAWQRLLIMIGGVLVNFLLALFIYAMCLFTWGDDFISPKNMTMGMKFNQEAKALGFHDGDILVGTEKGEFKEFGADLYRDLSTARQANIVRNGKPMTIALPGDINYLDMLKSTPQFVRPLIPARIDSIMSGSVAEKIGVRAATPCSPSTERKLTLTTNSPTRLAACKTCSLLPRPIKTVWQPDRQRSPSATRATPPASRRPPRWATTCRWASL